jgi:hypothetical protein
VVAVAAGVPAAAAAEGHGWAHGGRLVDFVLLFPQNSLPAAGEHSRQTFAMSVRFGSLALGKDPFVNRFLS